MHESMSIVYAIEGDGRLSEAAEVVAQASGGGRTPRFAEKAGE